jgi:hypothetical protein
MLMDADRAWKIVAENIEHSTGETLHVGAYELKQHKECFDGDCSKVSDQRKWAEFQ